LRSLRSLWLTNLLATMPPWANRLYPVRALEHTRGYKGRRRPTRVELRRKIVASGGKPERGNDGYNGNNQTEQTRIARSSLLCCGSIVSFPAGTLAWANVRTMERVRIGNHEGVTLFLEDSETLLENATGFKRMLLRLNKAIYLSPVHLSCDCIETSCDDLLASLRSRQGESIDCPTERREPDPRYLVPYLDSDYQEKSSSRA
jgi:hypothetical protein